MGDERARGFAAIVGSENLLQGEEIPKWYHVDGQIPRFVAKPPDRQSASQLIALAQEHSLGVIFRGGGTKMGLGNRPRRIDLVLSTAHLNQVVDLDGENLTLTVEAGIRLSEIQERLRHEGNGYFIPLDPPFTEGATLGGILATNSSGPKRLLYGTCRDFVLGLKVIQADGKICSFGGKTVKNVSGFDMNKLYIGSLGTLGMIAEITLRLLPLPEKERTLLAFFPESQSPFEVTSTILPSQLLPSSLEILDPGATAFLHPETLIRRGNYLLAIGLEGVAQAVNRQTEEIRSICHRFGPSAMETIEGEIQELFWRSLRDILPSIFHRFTQSPIVKISVPPSKTREIFNSAEQVLRVGNWPHALWAQGGNGILRAAFLLNSLGGERASLVQAIETLGRMTREMEGHIVVESSPTSLKSRISLWGQEREDFKVFRQIKEALDPASILNPGRFIGGI
jgi:glycolate oxidase FAD binding subunit